MKIESTAFKDNEKIPEKYTCDGKNISPSFFISDIPEGTESLVLIVDDPDAPSRSWVHWVVFNIDKFVGLVDEGEVPDSGIQGINDFGENNYGGPCPPNGEHRYIFKLYALDIRLDLLDDATKQDVEASMEGHVLEEAVLVGLYSKQNKE